MKYRVFAAAAAMALPASAVSGQDEFPQQVEVEWLAVASKDATRTVELERWQPIDFLEIVPARLFELEAKITDKKRKRVSKAGAIFAPVTGRDDIWCEPLRALRQINVVCLVDRDRDGAAEEFFRVKPRSEIFQDGKTGELSPLAEPAKLREVDPRVSDANLAIKLSYSGVQGGLFTKGRESFSVCYTRWIPALIASGKFVNSCLPPLAMLDGPVPQRTEIFGRTLVISAADKERATATILAPLDDVPL